MADTVIVQLNIFLNERETLVTKIKTRARLKDWLSFNISFYMAFPFLHSHLLYTFKVQGSIL